MKTFVDRSLYRLQGMQANWGIDMARIRVENVGQGQHPSEVMVSLNTINGAKVLIVDRRSLRNGSLDIGHPVGSEGNNFLIELPRETMSGEWRVLVPKTSVNDETVSA